MPLLDVLKNSPQSVEEMSIIQILAIAGNGSLSDSSSCSVELRTYLSQIPVTKIAEHIETCLSTKSQKIEKGGYILQDLVNELGRRLDYKVENGLYQGRSNQVGFDGIWEDDNGNSIVIEVKTTDAYRINLETHAGYRRQLIKQNRISEKSSILILVGRQDTGDLEAQIRGSRNAWDIRVISIDALLDLVGIKQKSDVEETTYKIQNLLLPIEYTRLDNLIDILRTTTADVEASSEELAEIDGEEHDQVIEVRSSYKQSHTPMLIADKVRTYALGVFSKTIGVPLITHKRTQAWSSDKQIRVVCSFSKKYKYGDFWYAFHPHQLTFLESGEKGFLLLSCLDHPFAYALPINFLKPLLDRMAMTENVTRNYWHIFIAFSKNGKTPELKLKGGEAVSIEDFAVRITE